MKATGQHLLVEYHNCDRDVLNDLHIIERLMQDAALAAKATVVASVFHPFSPQGVSGVVVIEESHLSIHTWPEHGYAAVDFFTCGECLPEEAHQVLKRGLGSSETERMLVIRGLLPDTHSMKIIHHDRESDLHAEDNIEELEQSTSNPLSHAQQAIHCSARR